MTCPACRHANRETAHFCEACGVRLEARCPACGSVTRAAARFCDTCGQHLGPIPAHRAFHAAGDTAVLETTRVEEQRRTPSSYTPRHLAERILADGRTLRGARREVTVLFVDVQGSTELAGLAFRHVLTCEVVYGGLLQTDRQARHRRAAEMLERLYRGRTEEVCDQLARQWAQSDCRVRALPYLLSASDAAVTVGANREGIGYLESALELAGEHPDALSREQVASLRLKLAGLHFIIGEG